MNTGFASIRCCWGRGLRFLSEARKTKLKLVAFKPFDSGVMRLHYRKGE